MCGPVDLFPKGSLLNPGSNPAPAPTPAPTPAPAPAAPVYTPAQAIAVSAPVPEKVTAPAPTAIMSSAANYNPTALNARTIRRGNAANTLATGPLGLSGAAPTATKQLLGQ